MGLFSIFFKNKGKPYWIDPRIAGQLLHTMPEAVVVANPNGVITYANESACRLLAVTPSNIKGRPLDFIISDKFSANKQDFIAGHVNSWEGFWRTADGRDIPVFCSSHAMKDGAGHITNIAYVAKDISELEKSKEAMLTAYKKLREARTQIVQAEKLAVIGKLAGGIAHEIRNPLAIILQGAYLLNNFIPDTNKDGKETIGMIRDAVNRSNAIISRLLEYSRQLPCIMDKCDVASVLEEAILLLEAQTSLENIEMIKNLPAEPIVIHGDKTTLAMMFFNILTNAVEAISGKGTVCVNLSVVGDLCKAEIKDTGCGINADDVNKIFEPFFTTKIAQKHAGLGLSLVQMIVSNHKGDVYINSNAGQGTAVTVTLPIYKLD